MQLDYEKQTKNFYKSRKVAESYHKSYASKKTWDSVRFRVQAASERRIVKELCLKVPHEDVLDLPAGTGKLATVFADLGSQVTACDISEQMLEFAGEEYKRLGYDRVEFHVCDAEKIQESLDRQFDLAVCLRLLHRVPNEIKRSVLKQLSVSAPYAVVSMGISSPMNDLRRRVRALVFQGRWRVQHLVVLVSLNEALAMLSEHFEVLDYKRTAYGLSEEFIFLGKSRAGSVSSV